MTLRHTGSTHALTASLLLASAVAPLHGQTLMLEPLGDLTEPGMSLFILELAPGRTAPALSGVGALFAYVLEGAIANQADRDTSRIYRANEHFHAGPHRTQGVLRNASQTELARVLFLQNTATPPEGSTRLLQEPLADLANQEVAVIKITHAPGQGLAGAHRHPGPIFAYLLKGKVESQVDPDPPKVYRAGDVFYEPPMHAHRVYRNLSETEPADLLVFHVRRKGQPLATRIQ
ncbi:MAG: cupin domain-containing protein [Bryobacteraceae bacterium]